MGVIATKNNATLVSPYVDLDIRDFVVNFTADSEMPASLDPNDADVMVDGEWLSLTASQVRRAGSNVTTPGTHFCPRPSWMLYAEKGRSDLQSIGGGKVPVIWRGTYEVDTGLWLVDDEANLLVGRRLTVIEGGAVTGGYATYSLLTYQASLGWTVGYVLKNAVAGEKLKIYCQAGGVPGGAEV